MSVLLLEQADALRDLDRVARPLDVDLVVIGAIALRAWISDERRQTEDIDVAVALDLDELASIMKHLEPHGWRQDSRWEPRWLSPQGARVDLLPIGERALAEGRIWWPRAETVMQLVGFDHLFRDNVIRELAPGLRIGVAPLYLLTLFKIAAYLDDPVSRQKDLGDILTILTRYQDDGDRRFSDEVLDAGVQFEEAGAYLLGLELHSRCSAPDEVNAIQEFLRVAADRDFQVRAYWLRRHGEDAADANRLAAQQFAALAKGFGEARRGA